MSHESDPVVCLAFCPVLFAAGGGRFDDLGRPILVDGVKGNCDSAFDCGHCPYLGAWVSQKQAQGFEVGWECVYCIKQTEGEVRELPGFYQSGRQPGEDQDNPGLTGCTRCGWETSFLQLVLRSP